MTVSPITGTSATASRKEWIGLAVLALPSMLYSMDLTVLNLAAPHLSADLQPTSSELLWIIDIYGFLIAGSLITMGTLGDRVGRRRLLLIGALAFGCASLLAAFATSAKMLIVTRALQGLAGATLAPSTLSLLRNMFSDPRERTFAIAVWSASFAVGAAIGPLVGGAMLARFWWGSVFLINIPVMALLLVLGPIFLPEYRAPDAGRLDVISAVLSLVAVLAVIFGIKSLAEHGGLALPVTAIAGGVALGWLFLHRQRKLERPFIDLSLFRSLTFNAALAVSVLTFFVNFGIFFLIAQYMQLVLGLSPLEAGLWMLPSATGFIVGSAFAPRLIDWIGPANLVAGGFVLAAAGLAVLSKIGGFSNGLTVVVTSGVMLALGLAPIIILTADLVVGAAPPERAGLASGMSEASTELGGALGIALLGSVMTAIYRSDMADLPLPGIPVEVIAIAQETLAGAASAAARLPTGVGMELLGAAREAFTDGVQLAAGIGASIAIATAIVASMLLRAATVPPSRTEASGFDPTGCSGPMRAHLTREATAPEQTVRQPH